MKQVLVSVVSRYVLQCRCGCQQFEYDPNYDYYKCSQCHRKIAGEPDAGNYLVKDSSVDYAPNCTFVKGEGNAQT